MRVLILHDYLDNIGGGERLMLTLAREIGADLATMDCNKSMAEAMGFQGVNVIDLGATTKAQGIKQAYASLKYRLCDLRDRYDFFVFSGNWSHYAALRHHPNMWYCHTPVRAFYTDYERLKASLQLEKRIPFTIWASIHRRLDKNSVKNIDRIVVNSKNTQGRVRRFYGRDSTVVYPGVDTGRYRFVESGGFWLSVNRLYPEKRVGLQVEAFRRMPDERLVVVGGNLEGDHSSAYVRQLLGSLPSNVEFRGRVGEGELVDLYGRCRGLVCTAVDEDFGMTPVEAMAAGKPVVATAEGGYLETVVDGGTGVLVDAAAEDIVRAVGQVSRDPTRYRKACQQRAAQFDTKAFVEGIQREINRI